VVKNGTGGAGLYAYVGLVLVSSVMRKINKILYFAILPPFLVSLVVLTFVVFMNDLGKWSELLITRNASFLTLIRLVVTILPNVLIFSLPLSFLIGGLIGISGLSGECQITALRACGVPLRRLLRPVMRIGAVIGILTALLSLFVLPKTNAILNDLKSLANLKNVAGMISPRVFNDGFDKVVFYLDDLSVNRQKWERVFLADNSDPRTPRIVIAREGSWVTDAEGSRLQLHLQDGMIYESSPQEPGKDNTSVFGITDIPIAFKDSSSPGDAARPAKPKAPQQIATLALVAGTGGGDPGQRREELVELQKRIALPCSVIGFAFVALALGTFNRSSGRTSGAAFSLILVLLYYVLFANGMRLARGDNLPIWLGVWGADLVLLAIGAVLLAHAEQNSLLAQLAASFQFKTRFPEWLNRVHLGCLKKVLFGIDCLAASTTNRISRSRFPKVLDSYIGRGFLVYFLWSSLVCVALFVILTLFDLLDEIIRNQARIMDVILYFFFLIPSAMLLCIPMSVLLAILILFGVLEKGSEVTAMKAGGWSLYRIALPVFLLALLVCGGVYFMQDYFLPYANIRQDALRDKIKNRPPQTTSKQKWIFGQSEKRIYNYDYLNPDKDIFVGLNVLDVDLHERAINRRIWASQATILGDGTWQLENGWVRDFRSSGQGFRTFTKEIFPFPEPASYFKKGLFAPQESAKLTYLDLRKYIEYLRKAGYNATELQVQLYMKISFPLSCFVMALLAVPFSFFMGKRGAFFGITASVAIAIMYWGIFRVFEQMGAYGMLSPELAAWSPNVLFGAAGLSMLFTIRT
jgi:LPS export ABC transporter permease LptG/LPS export ABC transporter permease LptF